MATIEPDGGKRKEQCAVSFFLHKTEGEGKERESVMLVNEDPKAT
jgi:hypothetical protein